MEVTRSIGYVQIYFGIFIILTGLASGIMAGIHASASNYYFSNSIENYEELSIEEKIYERQTEQYMYNMYVNETFHKKQIITQLIASMIILIALGVHATLHGIVHTRKGNPEHLHPKKRILQHLILAILLSILMLILIFMILA